MGTYTGVIRTAAARLGLSSEQYEAKRKAGLKYCWACANWLPELAFGLEKGRGDGLHPRCRECKNRHDRELYARRIERSRRAPKRVTPRSFRCDYCGAKPGKPCVVAAGRSKGKPTSHHKSRISRYASVPHSHSDRRERDSSTGQGF